MRKINAILIIAFLSAFTLNVNAATVWQVAAPANLYTTYSNAGFVSGDIIELTTDGGAYTWGTKLSTIPKSFTIRAASSSINRPVITPLATATLFSVNNSTAFTPDIVFDGVEFAGNNTITVFLIAGKTTTGGSFSLNINNCKFSGFPSTCNFVQYANSQSTDVITQNFGNVTMTNSIFIGGKSLIEAGSVVGANKYNIANNMIFTNNYFKDMTGHLINSNVGTIYSNSLLINHCTFDGCATTTLTEIRVGTTATTGAPTIIKNTLFANRGASTTANIFGGVGAEANTNNAVYYSGLGVVGTIYPTSALGNYVTAGFNVNPVIGTNYVATASVYYNAGSDGKTIGYVGPSGISTDIQNQLQIANNAISIIQNGSTFTISTDNAPFAVYATNGSQVAKGQIINGKINLNLNKGIYILKSNGKVAKFTVK
jgi:hypothetical protein